MKEIARIKKEIKHSEWAEMVKRRKESGLTVNEWCRQNGINLKTYYYRQKRMRQAVCNELEVHDIVPLEPVNDSEQKSEKIEISVGDVKITLPENFNEETLRRLLGVLR